MSADIIELRFCCVCKCWIGLYRAESICSLCKKNLDDLPPLPHYEPDDIIEPVKPVQLAKVKRSKIEGINVPYPGETWQELNEWRARYGLAPVGRKGR